MRRLLGVLREDAADAARDPQPSLAHVNELVETARGAGSPVTLTLEGAVAPLPAGVDLCAYRILQEALTNVRRHAPGAAVEVELEYKPDALHLRVRDHGPGSPSPDLDGHGLLGMRERAIMVGGNLHQPGRPTAAGLPSTPCFDRWRLLMTIKVAVVDDQEIVRAGFAALLGTQHDFRVVGRPPTATRRSSSATRSVRTSCSWTCVCRSWTASRRRDA